MTFKPTAANEGRVAGLLYFLLIGSGVFGIVYVPAVLFAWDDPAQTARNLSESGTLLRLGIGACLLSFLSFAALSAVLFRLLEAQARTLSLCLLAFGLVGAALYASNTAALIDGLALAGAYGDAADAQRRAIADGLLLTLSSFGARNLVAYLATAAWLAALGTLVLRSRIVPRVLGILLLVAACGYVQEFAFGFVLNGRPLPGALSALGLVGTLGEFGTCLWLLVVGARSSETPASARETTASPCRHAGVM